MSTTSVTLQPDVLAQVKQITEEKGITPEDFVNQAVRAYVEQIEDRTLEAEIEAFERLHPQLMERYLGQFVSVYQGEVIDADPDFETLFLRVQDRLGNTVVLIRQVTSQPTLELHSPTPQLERPGP
jgi:predicted DNA-binding protein